MLGCTWLWLETTYWRIRITISHIEIIIQTEYGVKKWKTKVLKQITHLFSIFWYLKYSMLECFKCPCGSYQSKLYFLTTFHFYVMSSSLEYVCNEKTYLKYKFSCHETISFQGICNIDNNDSLLFSNIRFIRAILQISHFHVSQN